MRTICYLFLFMLPAMYCVASPTIDHFEHKRDGKSYKQKDLVPKYGFYTEISGEKLTIVYLKAKDGKMKFRGCWMTKDLAEKLPMVVVRYIGVYIAGPELDKTQSIDKAIAIAKKAVDNALDQKWKNNLMTHGPAMVANLRYHRTYSVIDNNAYYEFLPQHLTAPDSTKPDYILKPASIISGFTSGELKNNLDAITTFLVSHPHHHDSKIVSNWPWVYDDDLDKWKINSDTINYHSKEIDTCKLKMELRKVNKGEPLPNMCWRQVNGAGWTDPPTYCNFFAQTLAALTFEKSNYNPETDPGTNPGWTPWGGQKGANDIAKHMAKTPDQFVDLAWKDCWTYVNLGYIVFFVWQNPSGGSGHICTGYPTTGSLLPIEKLNNAEVGLVVQAGTKGNTSIFQLEPGKPFQNKKLPAVKSYLYLGYLTAVE